MGIGKSSLCSKLSGIKLMFDDEDESSNSGIKYGEAIRVDNNNRKDLFQASNTKISVTKKTSFALTHLFGNEDRRQVMILDSPGFFDPEESASDKIRKDMGLDNEKRKVEDLHEKLQALGSIDCICLFIKLEGGRIPQNLVDALKALEKMFEKSKGGHYFNLALIVSKCDESQFRYYKKQMKNKEKEYQELKKTLNTYGIKFSTQNDRSQLFFLTALDESMHTIGRQDEFERLFRFFDSLVPLKTENLQNPTQLMQGIIYIII